MPSVSNILVEPFVTLREAAPLNGGVAWVHVEGLMCRPLCARRVRQALECLPGVREVSFNAASDTFQVRYSAGLAPDAVEKAVMGRVVLLGARRLVARLAQRVGWRPTTGPAGRQPVPSAGDSDWPR